MTLVQPRIELVFFDGCPHVALARAALREAIGSSAGWNWTEWNLDVDEVPMRLRSLPSPTVLIDGSPVGDTPLLPPAARACRSIAPSASEIRAALDAKLFL